MVADGTILPLIAESLCAHSEALKASIGELNGKNPLKEKIQPTLQSVQDITNAIHSLVEVMHMHNLEDLGSHSKVKERDARCTNMSEIWKKIVDLYGEFGSTKLGNQNIGIDELPDASKKAIKSLLISAEDLFSRIPAQSHAQSETNKKFIGAFRNIRSTFSGNVRAVE